MIKARKELGIKGFCAINGARRSTSSWCARASTTDVVEVQTDKHCAAVGASAGAAFGGACSMSSLGGTCRISSCDGGRCSMSTCGEALIYEDAKAVNEKEAHQDRKDVKIAEFLAKGAEITWTSAQNLHVTHFFGGKWGQFIMKQIFVLDFIWQCMLEGEAAGQADLHYESKLRQDHVFEHIVESISEQVQMRFFLDHIGMSEKAVGDDEEQEGQDKEADQKASNDALGSTEDVPQDVKMVPTDEKKSGKSYYADFMNNKKDMLAKAAETANLLRGGMMQADDSEDEPTDTHAEYLRVDGNNTLGNEKGPIEEPHLAYKCIENDDEDLRDWIVCKRFKRIGKAQAEEDEEVLKRLCDLKIQSQVEEESGERHGTPGSTEDVSWDAKLPKEGEENKDLERKDMAQHASSAFGLLREGKVNLSQVFDEHDAIEDEKEVRRLKTSNAIDATKDLRGGANRFEPLVEEEEEDEQTFNESCYDNEQDIEEAMTENEMDESFESIESGRSYYAEFYERKAAMQGGAGGGSTTQNKQLTNALDALAAVVQNMAPTQPDDDPEKVVEQIAKMVQGWKEKTPTRSDMRAQLRRLHVLLEQDCRRQADPAASREADPQQPKQSFYGEFVQKVREEQPAEGWKTKGSGKGGKKGKGKDTNKGGKAESSLPRFDLHRIWPAKAISTWQILEKELEAGKEPTGSVVIVENADKMAEYQSLVAAHSLSRVVIMVTKAGDAEPKNVNNPKVVWLPYLSNLALARAVVATTTGAAAEVQGMDPIKQDKSGPQAEELITLRIVVDLWLIEEDKKRDYLREHPHASLHEMAKGKLKEIKTHGWVIGEHVITGYCSLGVKEANIVLAMSGTSGVFTSRLRQDVAAQPPVTWVKVEEKESTFNYYRRVQQLAAENHVAIARRAGGGAFLGILKEDNSDRNRAWQISGIPSFWGPQSVKVWLQECGWTVENALRPPNGRYKTWAFQGRCEGNGKQTQFAYGILNGEKVHHITINHWQKKRVPPKEEVEKEQKLRGSRWWSADDTDPIEAMEISPTQKFEAKVADTVMDEETQDPAGKRASIPEKPLPGSKKKKVDTPKPVLKGGSMGPEGSSLLDLGGSGECGWRALSCMIALHNSPHKDLDAITEKVDVLATTLRAKTINYLVQHRTRWQDSWTPDAAANTTTEAGEPADNLETFINTVLRREKRWVCGLCLAGVSLLQGCTIVVWQYVGNAEQTHMREYWRRVAIIKGKESQKPVVIPVVLHYGHYYGLRYPALRRTWPKEWAFTKEEEDIPMTQNVNDTQKLTAISRGGVVGQCVGKDLAFDAPGSTEDVSWDINLSGLYRGGGSNNFETPKKRKREAEDLLRTFSTRRTKASNGNEDLLRTFSTKRSKASAKSSDDIENMLRVCEQDQLPSTVKKAHGKIWSCPICQEEIKIGDRIKSGGKITHHLRRLHYGVYLKAMVQNSLRNRHGAGLGMTGLVQPIPFRHMDEKDRAAHAEFVCPYCDMVLPLLAPQKKQTDSGGRTTTRTFLARLSKRQHLRCDCEYRHEKKGVTLRQYHNDYIKKSDVLNEDWYLKSSYMDKQRKKGHEPVVFRFEKRPAGCEGTRQMGKTKAICKRCRKGISTGDGAQKVTCRGEESRKPWSPGLIFWKCIKLNKKNQEVKEKLGMTQNEINHAHKAARHWCTKHGKCHQQGGTQEDQS